MATAAIVSASKPSKTLVLYGANDLRLETREVFPPAGSEVQVAIRATGLCGSDLHYYKHGKNGDFVVREPLCLGHESSGVVTAIGSDVKHLQVGDRIALEVGLPCRKCARCRQGRYNVCSDLNFRSSAKLFPHSDGTLMELTNHPAEMCHKLPDSVSFTGGALLEPLAVCVHAIRRSRPPTREMVEVASAAGEETAALVFGAGAIGLLLASALATAEAFTLIVVVDIDAARLEVAKSLNLGIKTTLIPSNTPPSVEAPHLEQVSYALRNAQALATLLKETHGIPYGFSRVFDCTGAPSCVQTGIYASAAGGALVLLGMGTPIQTLPLGAAALREVDLIGIFRYDGFDYPAAISLIASGKLREVEERVVTHRLKLTGDGDGQRAFTLAGQGVDEKGKPVVKVVVEG